MAEKRYDVVVIGAGCAGLSAAASAREAGAASVAVVETNSRPGGVLGQCIHAGFGLHTYNEELTGPEFAARCYEKARDAGVEFYFSAPVLSLNEDNSVTALSREEGLLTLRYGALVLATGCRERAAGNISIPGTRPAGVMTAGTAQEYINIRGYMVGRRAVILGSGDIGLIMARRLTLEGAKVICVAELADFSGGLRRNIVQCLEDFDIPLRLSTTVTRIIGKDRLTAVELSAVDPATRKPIPGTEEIVPCDTLLLSVGLVPDAELARVRGASIASYGGISVNGDLASSLPGVFACGNVVQVHDLADFAAQEGLRAGAAAARYALGTAQKRREIPVTWGDRVAFVCPARALDGASTEFSFRVRRPMGPSTLHLMDGEREIASRRRPFLNPGEMETWSVSLPEGLCGPIHLIAEENA